MAHLNKTIKCFYSNNFFVFIFKKITFHFQNKGTSNIFMRVHTDQSQNEVHIPFWGVEGLDIFKLES